MWDLDGIANKNPDNSAQQSSRFGLDLISRCGIMFSIVDMALYCLDN